jgi:hypothetical protein
MPRSYAEEVTLVQTKLADTSHKPMPTLMFPVPIRRLRLKTLMLVVNI